MVCGLTFLIGQTSGTLFWLITWRVNGRWKTSSGMDGPLLRRPRCASGERDIQGLPENDCATCTRRKRQKVRGSIFRTQEGE